MKFKKIKKGLVHVYTGNGKGKTSAALGLALRAVSYKKRVLVVQFIKGPWRSGELGITSRLKPYLEIYSFGAGFVKILGDRKPIMDHKRAARKALDFVKREMRKKKFEVIILDEIIVAIKRRLLSQSEVLKLIRSKPADLELVLTGRGAGRGLKDIADYVSEIREIKHPFQQGILAREGIDY